MSEKEEFEKAFQTHEKNEGILSNLHDRQYKAEKAIEQLEGKLISLKEQRQKMLADEIDITNLNKEMKEIEEEISIKNDEIIGVKAKYTELDKNRQVLKREVNSAYEKFVASKLAPVAKKYNKIAEQFAEVVKDYATLQNLSHCSYRRGCYYSILERLNFIPQIGSENEPFLKTDVFAVVKENKDRVIEKYELPDFHYLNERD